MIAIIGTHLMASLASMQVLLLIWSSQIFLSMPVAGLNCPLAPVSSLSSQFINGDSKAVPKPRNSASLRSYKVLSTNFDDKDTRQALGTLSELYAAVWKCDSEEQIHVGSRWRCWWWLSRFYWCFNNDIGSVCSWRVCGESTRIFSKGYGEKIDRMNQEISGSFWRSRFSKSLFLSSL